MVRVFERRGCEIFLILATGLSSLDSFSIKSSSFSSIRSNNFVILVQINYYGNNIFPQIIIFGPTW